MKGRREKALEEKKSIEEKEGEMNILRERERPGKREQNRGKGERKSITREKILSLMRRRGIEKREGRMGV
jgi:hypothetical protein